MTTSSSRRFLVRTNVAVVGPRFGPEELGTMLPESENVPADPGQPKGRHIDGDRFIQFEALPNQWTLFEPGAPSQTEEVVRDA